MQAAVQAGAHSRRVDMTGALRDAGFTGLVAFGLLLPLIGFRPASTAATQLVLTTRWPLLFAVVAIIAACRFLYSLRAHAVAGATRRATGASRAIDFCTKLRGALAKWFVPSPSASSSPIR